MQAEALYDGAVIAGNILRKYLDDGKFSKTDVFSTLLSDLGDILAFVNSVKDVPAQLYDLDTEERAEAARLFHQALGDTADKTKADEVFDAVLGCIPAGRDAIAAFRADTSAAAKWEAIKPAGDALFKVLGHFTA